MPGLHLQHSNLSRPSDRCGAERDGGGGEVAVGQRLRERQGGNAGCVRSHHFSAISQLANPRVVFVEGEFRDTATAGIHWVLQHTNVGSIHIFGYNDTLSDAQMWETTLHEGGHHHGYSDVGSFNAYTAETCATRDRQKENQLKAGGGGGGGYWYYKPPVYTWVCEDECVSSPNPPGIDCGDIEVDGGENCQLVKVSDGEWVWVET